MFIRLTLLLTIVIIAIQGEISSSTIKTDAEKLTKLFEQYSQRPPILYYLQSIKIRCSWLIECCPNELASFASLTSENRFAIKCIHSAKQATGAQCKTLIYPEPQGRNREPVEPEGNFTQYIFPWIKRTENACSVEERHKFYCEEDTLKQFQSCQIKMLQTFAQENNEKNYTTFINHLEKDLKDSLKM